MKINEDKSTDDCCSLWKFMQINDSHHLLGISVVALELLEGLARTSHVNNRIPAITIAEP